MRLIPLVATVALFGLAPSMHAQSQVFGVGGRMCRSWRSDFKLSDDGTSALDYWTKAAQMSWVEGYVSGQAGNAPTRSLARMDREAMEGFIDDYCVEHPLRDISDSAAALVESLRERAQ